MLKLLHPSKVVDIDNSYRYNNLLLNRLGAWRLRRVLFHTKACLPAGRQGYFMGALHFNEGNFGQEVERSTLPVLVDFWAEWCGPCKAIGPIIEQLSDELQGRMKVGKVNVDECPDLAGKFNIMSIPSMLIFKNGAPVDQIVGAMPKDRLLEKINPHL